MEDIKLRSLTVRTIFFVIIVLFNVQLFSLNVLGNGGPEGTSSRVIGRQVEFIDVPQIELKAEKLYIKPDFDKISVRVEYTLVNNGGELETSYVFPVFSFLDEYKQDSEDGGFAEIKDFEMYDNGKKLDYTIEESDVITLGDNEYINIYHRANLNFSPNEEKVLVIEYTCQPEFVDWVTSKSFFTSFDYRSFHYDMSPAGNWGNGVVSDFELIMDISAFEKKGIFLTSFSFARPTEDTPYNASEINLEQYGFEMQSDGVYKLNTKDFKINGDSYLFFDYNTHEYLEKLEIIEANQNNNIKTVRTSTTLDGYSPKNMFDSNLETAWVEGSEGLGVGDWIELEFDKPMLIDAIYLLNGFHNNESTLVEKGRVGSFDIYVYTEDGEEHYYQYEKVNKVDKVLGVYTEFFTYRLSNNITKLKLVIKDAENGSVYEDIAISELIVLSRDYDGVFASGGVSQLEVKANEGEIIYYEPDVNASQQNEKDSIANKLEVSENTEKNVVVEGGKKSYHGIIALIFIIVTGIIGYIYFRKQVN